MSVPPRLVRLAFACVLSSTLISACAADHGVTTATAPTEPPSQTAASEPEGSLSSIIPSGAVQTAIQELPANTDGSITFVVRVASHDVGVSAYQGTVTFAPGALQFVNVTVPAGSGNEVYAVNPADFSQGRIRFAACSATTFAGTTVGDGVIAFRFTVRVVTSVAGANLAAALSVAGTESGAGLTADHVLGTAGVRATASVPQQ
ncbi:MAG TPA: hypothetical protein VE967_05980 [Gemmatimonadaceae bacterium]|nr:hypothetical protein [Gemmatimonadaceae bacterium]